MSALYFWMASMPPRSCTTFLYSSSASAASFSSELDPPILASSASAFAESSSAVMSNQIPIRNGNGCRIEFQFEIAFAAGGGDQIEFATHVDVELR